MVAEGTRSPLANVLSTMHDSTHVIDIRTPTGNVASRDWNWVTVAVVDPTLLCSAGRSASSPSAD